MTTHALIDNPNKKAPNGESYQIFLSRTIPFLRECVESNDLYVIVTHNRVVTLIKALSKNKGKFPDTDTLKRKGPIDPSGIMIVRKDWTISFQSQKDAD